MNKRMSTPQTSSPQLPGIDRIKRFVAVASGKGGVGKTTVAINLAFALQKMGFRVGLLDADVFGPSVPVMLDFNEPPQSKSMEP